MFSYFFHVALNLTTVYAVFETKKLETFFCFGNFCFEIPKQFFLKLFFVSNKNVSIIGLISHKLIFFSKAFSGNVNLN